MSTEHTYLVVWADEGAILPKEEQTTSLSSSADVHGGDLVALGQVEDRNLSDRKHTL